MQRTACHRTVQGLGLVRFRVPFCTLSSTLPSANGRLSQSSLCSRSNLALEVPSTSQVFHFGLEWAPQKRTCSHLSCSSPSIHILASCHCRCRLDCPLSRSHPSLLVRRRVSHCSETESRVSTQQIEPSQKSLSSQCSAI